MDLITDTFAVYNGDCVEVMQNMPNESIDFSIYSPPFGGLYHYSSDPRDMSNCDGYDHFLDHYSFVIREIARITKPGRCTAVHCTDIPTSNSGKDGLIDFPGDVIRAHAKHGFEFISRHTIWKEPLWVRNRTMVKNLAHKTIVDDAVYGGVASADYLIIFRKVGENKVPVAHPQGINRYAGEEPMPEELFKYRGWSGKQTENRFSHWIWRHYASSVWDDIRMHRVLPYKESRDPEDEKHVHPLQLDVIERAIVLRTNPGETVFTPFMGVGSEVYSAVDMGRRGIGVELKPSYFNQAVANLNSIGGRMHKMQVVMDEKFISRELLAELTGTNQTIINKWFGGTLDIPDSAIDAVIRYSPVNTEVGESDELIQTGPYSIADLIGAGWTIDQIVDQGYGQRV